MFVLPFLHLGPCRDFARGEASHKGCHRHAQCENVGIGALHCLAVLPKNLSICLRYYLEFKTDVRIKFLTHFINFVCEPPLNRFPREHFFIRSCLFSLFFQPPNHQMHEIMENLFFFKTPTHHIINNHVLLRKLL